MVETMRYLALLLLLPAPLAAQWRPHDVPLSFPTRAEVEVLVPVRSDMADAPPGFRLSLQRRVGLNWAASGSALFLADPLNRVTGATLGGSGVLHAGRSVIEPFLELGAAQVETRIDGLGYEVIRDDGSKLYVPVYQASRGTVFGGGAGLTASAVVGNRLAVRLTAGYWQFRQEELGLGALHLGVGLGLARRDARWYRLRTDRQPPFVRAVDALAVAPDSVVPRGGYVTVAASDANGIAEIRANGQRLALEPPWPDHGRDVPNPERMVVARFAVVGSFDGEPVTVTVRDSAGLKRTLQLRAYPPPDRAGPFVRVVERSDAAGSWIDVRAFAEDPSGLADAHLNGCPLTVAPLEAAAAEALGLTGSVFALRGGAPARTAPPLLVVRDQLGNRTEMPLPVQAPAPPGTGLHGPLFRDVTAVSRPGPAAQRSVEVRAFVRDSAGLASITVEGHPASAVLRAPDTAEVYGWVLAEPDRTTISIVATSLDGRTTTEEVVITAAPPRDPGVVHVLALHPDAEEPPPALRRLDRPGVRLVELRSHSHYDVEGAVLDLRRRLAPEDVLVVHLDATLQAVASTRGIPGLSLDDRPLALETLAATTRGHGGRLSLVGGFLRPGRGWTATLPAPGATPPAGCMEAADRSTLGFVDLERAPLSRLLEALDGRADADGDGWVRAGELVEYLGGEIPAGWLPYDPFDPVIRVEGGGP
jgi:hypothetical protein